MSQILSRASLHKLPQAETLSTKTGPKDFHSVTTGRKSSTTHSVSEISGKLPDDLREILKKARSCRQNLLNVLGLLDVENTLNCSYALFDSALIDSRISIDSKSQQYIIENLCDEKGNINYSQVIKDFVI
jgi:hypothetical protein